MNYKIDFMGIGFPRCATSSITTHLSNHLEISMFSLKDTDYFSTLDKLNKYIGKYELNGIEGYYKILKEDGINFNKIVGEFCTQYAYDTKAMERINKHFPDIKIIVAIRNPVDRFESHYNMIKLNNMQLISKEGKILYTKNIEFKEFVKLFPNFVDIGRYDYHLKPIIKMFKNIKIINYEDFIKNPKEVMKDLYEYLEVDEGFISTEINEVINPTSKSLINHKLMIVISKTSITLKKLGLTKMIKYIKDTFIGKKFDELNNWKPTNKIKLSLIEREYLKEEYKNG